ncbi:autoinducer 2 sensor kinase/phosphatase LuxQ [Acrasis kona]|uniref:Autoinducer 2 sensor kinase/phosphatase LuxQ n=1 Tax=Acrasis kona TaxID=1008807 RepID=A0AAW2YZF8_9EUKA
MFLEKSTEKGNMGAIILEYIKGACNLTSVIPASPPGFDVDLFLNIAVQITKGLTSIHEANITHKDIKPNNMGITFYQLLTGSLPFTTNDVLQLIHRHIAHEIPRLSSQIPTVLSKIIYKLTKKDAEERYQSCRGLLYDLETCLDRATWSGDHFDILPFPIATCDFTEKFSMPKRLYDRDDEIKQLTDTFERVSTTGRIEMVLVGGYSLVRELQKPVELKSGIFISGKFDQLERNVPYSAITNALNSLVKQINDTRAEEYKKDIQVAIDATSLQVLCHIVPNIQELMGEQQPCPSLSFNEFKNVLQRVTVEFLQVCARQSCPIVLFLDDMQWSDRESLQLIESIANQNSICNYLMLIMAYRDNQVTENSFVMQTLKQAQQRIKSSHMILSPISLHQVSLWIADALHSDRAQELANIVHRKTNGNPFFVKLFMDTLFQYNLLSIVPSKCQWQWNMNGIKQLSVTENVVDLMTRRISQFQDGAKNASKWLSCFGSHAHIERLATSMNESSSQILEDLYPILNAGLCFLSNSDQIQFSHDRVQESCYALLTPDEKISYHYTIAHRWVPTNVPLSGKELCEVIDHKNKGMLLITDKEELRTLAGENLQAGTVAMGSSAFSTAKFYFNTGAQLFRNRLSWKSDHLLGFQLYMGLAKTCIALADSEEALLLYNKILNETNCTDVERAMVYQQIIQLKFSQNDVVGCMNIGSDVLRSLFQIKVPDYNDQDSCKQSINEVYPKLTQLFNIDLYKVNREVNAEKKVLYDLLISIITCAYYSGNTYFCAALSAITCHVMLTTGITEESSSVFAYHASYSTLICPDDFSHCVLFSKWVHMCIDLFPDAYPQRVRAIHLFTVFSHHWLQPIREIVPNIQTNMTLGISCGEVLFGSYAFTVMSKSMFFSGYSLSECTERLKQMIETATKYKNVLAADTSSSVLLLVRHLQNSYLLQDTIVQEQEEFLSKTMKTQSLFANTTFKVLQLIFEVIMIDPSDVISPSSYIDTILSKLDIKDDLKYVDGCYVSIYYVFVASLLIIRCLRLYDQVGQPDPNLMDQLKIYMSRLLVWKNQNADNFANKYCLVLAEYTCYIEKDPWTAISMYEQSITYATNSKFLYERAIAYECYSQCTSQRIPRTSSTLLELAFCDYQELGAKRKTSQMLNLHPQLSVVKKNRSTDPFVCELSSSATINQSNLDLQGLIRTSEIISTTIDMNALLFNVLKIIIETAGATNGCVLIDNKIEAMVHNGEITTMCDIPVEKWQFGSIDIIKRVMESKQEILLGNAYLELEDSDAYVKTHQCKSILCMPILHQDDIRGCLYMNNDLMTDCFKTENIKVLNILTSQLYGRYFESRMKGMEKLAFAQKKRAEQEKAYRRKHEEFIDRICHEIRNPIQGIVGNCETIKDIMSSIKGVDPDNEKNLLECVENIVICGQYQRVVTDDVLTLSKLEMNKIVLDQIPVHILMVIKNAFSMNKSEGARKRINFVCEFNNIDEDTVVVMDGNRLTTVLINLLTNAIKFTSSGSVSLISTLHPDNQLEIVVRDTGCGMTPSEMNTLFNRFSQATQRIYSEYGGSGLGLFISKAIIDLMGGSIRVRSEKGVGTEFKILVKVTMASSEQQSSLQHPKVTQPARRVIENPKVLVVEDNKINQRVITRMLGKLSCQCTVADNGLEAVNMYKVKGPFDLVVMDISMPLMDGYEATREIRKFENEKTGERAYITGLSGNVRDEHRDAGIESGMDDFMCKPIGQKEVEALIKRVLAYYDNGKTEFANSEDCNK